MKILVTGSTGFIGFHVIKKHLQRGDCVAGRDNTSESFDPGLRYACLAKRIISHDAGQWHLPESRGHRAKSREQEEPICSAAVRKLQGPLQRDNHQQATTIRLKRSAPLTAGTVLAGQQAAIHGEQATPEGGVPCRICNIGNSSPVLPTYYILENCPGNTAGKIYDPMQPGGVPGTDTDVTDLAKDMGYRPHTAVQLGIGRF